MPWTEAMKEKQRQRILKNQPWLKSTGPITEEGKQASSKNAVKHGHYTAHKIALRKLLYLHKYLSDSLYNETAKEVDRLGIKSLLSKKYQRKELSTQEIEEKIENLVNILNS